MATILYNEDWVHFNSDENPWFEDDDDEEALSLCDLPTNDHEIDAILTKQDDEPEEFEFGCNHGGAAIRSPEDMCTAEEVFFQGRILPLRLTNRSDASGLSRKISRSASMSVIGSRSNRNDPRQIRSNELGHKLKPTIRNQFHSHPSPSPQIRTQSFRALSHPNLKTSSLWSFLQVGLLKPQEIGLSDLKNRSKRFGSHNSNSSSNSSGLYSTIDQKQTEKEKPRKNRRKKQRLFFGGCKCSVDSIESTNAKKKKTKEQTMLELQSLKLQASAKMMGEGKQAVSRHRTFEWLKQLSIAAVD